MNEAYYALNGDKTFVPAKDHPEWDQEAGRKNTIAYQIIARHNTSGDPCLDCDTSTTLFLEFPQKINPLQTYIALA